MDIDEYYPDTYISPCQKAPMAFDFAIQHARSVDAIKACRQLCKLCHPEHQRRCLETYRTAPGVVAGLTLEQRTRRRRSA